MTKETKDWKKGIAEAAEKLVEEYGHSREVLFGENGIALEFHKALVEAALQGEMSYHLGYPPRGEKPEGEENSRNGYSKKTVISKEGEIEINQPRDRQGSFKPILIEKGQKRFDGWDDKIIGMYARGMSVREIRAFLIEQYKIEVSPDFISTVTDTVIDEIKEWQNRPLEEVYAIVYLDALRVKIRDQGSVKNKAVYLALGISSDGNREILGIWIEENEGAKFWQKILNELRNRGVRDILISVVDGLKGFPEAINAIFPESQIQTCIVHLIRYSLSFCGWKERKAVAQELKEIYKSPTSEIAEKRLEEFDQSELGKKYPMIAQSWRRNWEEVIPFFHYPQEIRTMIYTTNVLENVNMRIRKIIKTRGHFPSDEAATKLIYLALRNTMLKWRIAPFTWPAASRQFAISFGERFKK
jgi:putative transposase